MPVRYATSVEDSARWADVELRSDDIVITTPATCGTTWMQMICALLVLQTRDLPAPLHELSPWVDAIDTPVDVLIERLDAQRHRRFIKTHTPLDGLPHVAGVTYISVGRGPRDVAASARDHVQNMNEAPAPIAGLDEHDFFWWWVENDLPITDLPTSFRRLVHHLEPFWKVRDDDDHVLVHYADLTSDLDGQMRALADTLGIDVPESQWPSLVQSARFDTMREHSATTAPGDERTGRTSSRSSSRPGADHGAPSSPTVPRKQGTNDAPLRSSAPSSPTGSIGSETS